MPRCAGNGSRSWRRCSGTAPPANPPSGGANPPAGEPPRPTTGGEATAPAPGADATKRYATLVDFDKHHPGDVAVLQGLYERFLRDFPDTGTDEYVAAAK